MAFIGGVNMKIWQRHVLGIAVVPIIWGIIVDLKYGHIASFITRVIGVTLIALLLETVYEKASK